MFFVSFGASSRFRENRLTFFAKEKQDIPIPYRHEDFQRTLEGCRLERDAFRKKYRQSLEGLPEEPDIAPDMLRSLPDDEARRVFEALETEGKNAGDVLLLRTYYKMGRELARCKQEVHEQVLVMNALQDVRKMQIRLHDYMREQTARENLDDDPDQSKSNKAKAFALLNIISEIGNAHCRFPEKGKKEKPDTMTEREWEDEAEEREKLMQARKKFRYHCIRDWETFCDENGKPILSLHCMRSLAFLHMHFNGLHVDRAMDARSIALAEHSGEDLLTLARSDLDPSESKPLLDLAKSLRSGNEPMGEDFPGYPAVIETLPALPKLILTLLYGDIIAARPHDIEDKYFGREDLIEQFTKGGNIVTDGERAILMRELIEYLADYSEALAEGEGTKNEGFTEHNALRIYDLLRENARKYLFQSGVNYIYLTGSDHGVKHLIQGNVRFTTQVAEQLQWSAQDRVCLRQIAVDHDLGYTHAALQRFNTLEEGIPLDNGYYGLVKDHPLYSSAYFEAHRPEYEEYFGKQGARNIGVGILDHSEVKGHLRDRDPAKRIQALFCRIDCMAVSADLKNAPAFMDPKVLVAMSKAFEAVEYLKDVDQRMGEIWKGGDVRGDEYKWLATVQASLRVIANQVKAYLLGLDKEIYENSVYQQAYHRAIDQHYDPFNPKFPTQRDFGSNAIAFAGIDVRSIAERDLLTARLSIEPLFFLVAQYFGGEQGSSFATSAISKLLKDFGANIHNPSKLIQAFDVLSSRRQKWHTENDVAKHAQGSLEYHQHHPTHVHFEFTMPKRGESSPLIKLMTKLMPSLIMVRDLLRPDFDSERLKSVLEKFADDTENDEISASIQNGDLEGATEHFLTQHFILPK